MERNVRNTPTYLRTLNERLLYTLKSRIDANLN